MCVSWGLQAERSGLVVGRSAVEAQVLAGSRLRAVVRSSGGGARCVRTDTPGSGRRSSMVPVFLTRHTHLRPGWHTCVHVLLSGLVRMHLTFAYLWLARFSFQCLVHAVRPRVYLSSGVLHMLYTMVGMRSLVCGGSFTCSFSLCLYHMGAMYPQHHL